MDMTAAEPVYADTFLPMEDSLQAGMAFLAENPEAFGLVPDARPVATRELLIAVNGYGMEGGGASPTHVVETVDVDDLFDTPYNGLLPRTDENAALLRATFGNEKNLQEHLVARYCAVLAEAVAWQVLRGPAKGASLEQTVLLLGREITQKLSGLREILRVAGNPAAQESVFFTVSLGACRVTGGADGCYDLDVFAAGDFRVFLLDGQGMRPLWMTDTPVLSPDLPTLPTAKRFHICHPEPFAILLLSDSVCAPDNAEYRASRENPGLVWQYRMRLEDGFLRLFTGCAREQEFGERASRYFMGRAHGRDSASGAVAVLRGGASYEVFRAACEVRLRELEGIQSLLPEGYNPADRSVLPSRPDTEMDFLRHLSEKDPSLTSRVEEALKQCALEKLKNGPPAEPYPLPADVPAYERLDYDEVWSAYRLYDGENDADRAFIAENSCVLRETLSDHWITLRPLLRKAVQSSDAFAETGDCRGTDMQTYEAHSERLYETCLALNSRLAGQLEQRSAARDRLETILSDALDVLRSEGNDWVSGRAGDDSPAAWARTLSRALPEALHPLLTDWQTATDGYRSLLSAYTAERDRLFSRDIATPEGWFAADWEAIRDGQLPAERWEALRDEVSTHGEAAAYTKLLEALRRISHGTEVVRQRIRERDAEHRMASDIAARPALRLAALRGSAYEDPDWGEAVLNLLDSPTRMEFRATVRRWKEARELNEQQTAAYEAYRTMYETYMRTGE